MTPPPPTILHVDMDAFFAAIEAREDPSLAGRPLVVGADPQGGRGRGVVATASYEARRFGIRSAMPISEAYRRCPHAAWVRPRLSLYSEVSARIFEIFGRYTDAVEGLSLDEAFLDVSASRALFGGGPEIAAAIKADLRAAERLTASVGVASSKYVAKVASDLEKPDGLVTVPAGREREFLAPLDLSRLWGAGPKARERLRSLGARSIGDVASMERAALERSFGEALGRRFHELARGVDPRPVASRARKSLGHETTFDRDVADRARVERTLLGLCESVGRDLRRRDLAGRTVHLKLRWEGFETVTRQRTLPRPVALTEQIWPVARELFRHADRAHRRVRLVGVSVSGFEPERPRQLALFGSAASDAGAAGDAASPADAASPVDAATSERIARAMDRLNARFGRGAVTRAALLGESGREHEDA